MSSPGHDDLPGHLTDRALRQLRAWRTELLTLHKLLLDAERIRYERQHGRIESPHELLQLVMRDAWFEWLRPLADLIVQIDERLADPRPVEPVDAAAFRESLVRLLHFKAPHPVFPLAYRQALQEHPDVVVTHGRLMALLAEATPPP